MTGLKIGLIGLLGLIVAACGTEKRQDEKILLDVKAIVNKSPAQVEEILGEADSVYTFRIMGKEVFCQLYKDDNVEIQYPDSVATDILVKDAHQLPFDQTALSAFGLDYRKHPSDYKKGSFIRWSDFEEFSAISFYNTKKDCLDRITGFSIFFKSRNASI